MDLHTCILSVYVVSHPSTHTHTHTGSSQKHGDIRLSGYGSCSLAGRLEIYFNGKWGTVCGDIKFDLLTASVACRQLSLGPAVSVTYYPDLR